MGGRKKKGQPAEMARPEGKDFFSPPRDLKTNDDNSQTGQGPDTAENNLSEDVV